MVTTLRNQLTHVGKQIGEFNCQDVIDYEVTHWIGGIG